MHVTYNLSNFSYYLSRAVCFLIFLATYFLFGLSGLLTIDVLDETAGSSERSVNELIHFL